MKVYHSKISFKGRVQGVGFRYQTVQIAKGYDVSGYVKNELDGTVTLEAEGEKSEVTAFIDEVSDTLSPFIRESDISTQTGDAEFAGFTIR